MIKEQVKQEIITDYTRYLLLNDVDPLLIIPSIEIDAYISGLWWDLVDEIDNLKDDFGINKNMETMQAAHIAEKLIERTLKEYYLNK